MHALMHYVGRENRKDATIPCWPFNSFMWSGVNEELCTKGEEQGCQLSGYAAKGILHEEKANFYAKKQVGDNKRCRIKGMITSGSLTVHRTELSET